MYFWILSIIVITAVSADITDIADLSKCSGLGLANLTQGDVSGIISVFNVTDPRIHYNTIKLIEAAGYSAESHYVKTKDGYILNIFRIPRIKTMPLKGVVLFQHGLLSSSDGWLINYKEKILPYILLERGYDIWLGNNRGNHYSRNHTNLDPDELLGEFWNFSWHEMGLYDIPAMVDHILGVTGAKQIFYVGHSQGTTQYFAGASLNPTLNAKIRLMVALAPPEFVGDMYSALVLLAPLEKPGLIDNLLCAVGTDGTGSAFSTAQNALLNYLLPVGCATGITATALCDNIFFLIMGYDFYQSQNELVPLVAGHFPQEAAMKCLLHYGQLINNKKFQQFDYGPGESIDPLFFAGVSNVLTRISSLLAPVTSVVSEALNSVLDVFGKLGLPRPTGRLPTWLISIIEGGNQAKYGSSKVPEYDLSKITAPVVLYAGPNDALAVESGVKILAPLVPGNIDKTKAVKYRRVNYECFNHGDFLFARDVNELLNNDVVSVIAEFS